MAVCCLLGLTIAVNAAAPTKKTSKPTNIPPIPLILRRPLFPLTGPEPAPGGTSPPNRTVCVNSDVSSPSRNPQLRQKRSSDGITEWQFEQVITCDVGSNDLGNSGFSDIGVTCLGF